MKEEAVAQCLHSLVVSFVWASTRQSSQGLCERDVFAHRHQRPWRSEGRLWACPLGLGPPPCVAAMKTTLAVGPSPFTPNRCISVSAFSCTSIEAHFRCLAVRCGLSTLSYLLVLSFLPCLLMPCCSMLRVLLPLHHRRQEHQHRHRRIHRYLW